MTTRTAIKPRRWQVGTRIQHKPGSKLPNVQKPFTCADDAGINELLACYSYLVLQPNGHLWLANLYPRHELEAAAERIRAKLAEGRAANQPGNTLVKM